MVYQIFKQRLLSRDSKRRDLFVDWRTANEAHCFQQKQSGSVASQEILLWDVVTFGISKLLIWGHFLFHLVPANCCPNARCWSGTPLYGYWLWDFLDATWALKRWTNPWWTCLRCRKVPWWWWWGNAGNAGILDSMLIFIPPWKSLGSELRRVNVYPCFVLVSAKYLNQAASGCVWTRHHTLECGCSICTLCSSATPASTIKLGEVTMEELVAASWWQQILLFWGSSKVLFTWLNRCLSNFALYCLLKSRFVAISAMVLLNCKVDDLLSERGCGGWQPLCSAWKHEDLHRANNTVSLASSSI